MRLSYLSLLAVSALATACYKPEFSSNPDANMAFRCHKSDNPVCPSGLVCCVGTVCGDDLMDSDEGWCVNPPPPVDMSMTAFQYWPFPTKTAYYGGDVMEQPLTGYDDQMQWRCKRDDANPDPPPAIQRMFEPNDWPDAAIVLTNPLPVDPPGTSMGAAYEICPDKSAPDQPDVDVFKFKVINASHVIARISYKVNQGDLDMAVFQLVTDPDTMVKKPMLVNPNSKDVTAMDNACVEFPSLMPGTYYIVVRGTNTPEHPEKYWNNTYSIQAYSVMLSGDSCGKKDGGP